MTTPNELETIIERCRIHPRKIVRCFLTKGAGIPTCDYMNPKESRAIARDKDNNPYIFTYYLCNKPKPK